MDEYIATAPAEARLALEALRSTVREALDAAGLMEAYLARPPYQRNDYLGWIARPKREATLQAHLDQMLDELARGDVYMKMPWHGRG